MIKQLCYLALKAQGWKFEVQLPEDLRSFVFLGAPHTSNHDFMPAMAVAWVMQRNARFLIKSDWMKFPLNLFMGPLGAMGLDRKLINQGQPQSNTDAMAQVLKEHPDLVLMIAPEGTRKGNSKWKTGFYYVAQKAGVPIALGYADYARKKAGIGPIIYPTDYPRDMQQIMQFYQHIGAKIPSNFQLDDRF
jgi:1-acyl-sn-glycerol-3-phosphate acyltransferase